MTRMKKREKEIPNERAHDDVEKSWTDAEKHGGANRFGGFGGVYRQDVNIEAS